VRRPSERLKKLCIQHNMNNITIEQRYKFVLVLYNIRRRYPAVSCFQPDFIWKIFKPMMPSKYDRSDYDIKAALNAWCNNSANATAKYGHISKWNTSMVTNLKKLFSMKKFNDDISKWDVSNVTDMSYMFSVEYGSRGSFNGDISGWNVSSVTNMSSMFSHSPFNGDISGWNVSNVTNMEGMFSKTPFGGDISGWNVSSVTNMEGMFYETPFNGDISGWNVSNVTDMDYMFSNCPITVEHKPIRRGREFRG
jgi:surface protein